LRGAYITRQSATLQLNSEQHWICSGSFWRGLHSQPDQGDAVKHSEDSRAEPSSDADRDTVERSTALGSTGWSRWIAPAGLVIGLVALVLALVQWFHPLSNGSASPSFSAQQAKDAKTSVCAAYTTVHRAVAMNTNLENPPDGGPLGPLVVATSARLALYGGGSYLRDRLASQPAAPADLTKAIDSLATTLEDLAVNYLAGVPALTQDQLRHNLDAQLVDVDGLCK
jgi:hypothetical protein